MSNTPRTNNYIENFPGSRREPRLLDFARQLERELADKDRQLAEARAEMDALSVEVGQALVLRSVDFSSGEEVEPRSHAIWVAMRETIKERDEARAEIERLALLAQNQQIVIDAQSRSIQAKDKQIEQMREALRLADDLIDEYAADYEHRDNVDEVRDMIKAALPAAERS